MIRSKIVWAAISVLGVLACSSETKAPPEAPAGQPPGQASPISAESPPAVIDPACPAQGGQREEILKGQCVKGAECSFSTPAGVENCKPGMRSIPVVPTEWKCTCPEAEWSCTVTGGGLGVVNCPGFDSGAP